MINSASSELALRTIGTLGAVASFLTIKWYLGAGDSSQAGGHLQYDGVIRGSSLVWLDAGGVDGHR